jgi:hypothetical protein
MDPEPSQPPQRTRGTVVRMPTRQPQPPPGARPEPPPGQESAESGDEPGYGHGV